MTTLRWVNAETGEEKVVSETEGVWQHPCGSQFFYLNDNGTVTCAWCGFILPSMHWERHREQ